jgi:hypothetical protein
MRHCGECRRVFSARHDICPDCWEPLAAGAPAGASCLALVYQTGAWFEADIVESLLHEEGIPVVRVPRHASTALPLPVSHGSQRIYVRDDMAPAARALIAEVTGGRIQDA